MLFQNGVPRSKPGDLDVISDDLVDGSYLRSFVLNRESEQSPFVKGDRVRVELQSITADNYYFLNEVLTQIHNQGLFATPPASVRTNVHNVNASSSHQAVGYFGGYAVRTDSLVIR